jgi:hypothetical protein
VYFTQENATRPESTPFVTPGMKMMEKHKVSTTASPPNLVDSAFLAMFNSTMKIPKLLFGNVANKKVKRKAGFLDMVGLTVQSRGGGL